ncbi:MAG TPA: transglycosylase family protein [Aeromicrobium sp.]|nr:transglycosylase family protein [Aeromicrobium sp.]
MRQLALAVLAAYSLGVASAAPAPAAGVDATTSSHLKALYTRAATTGLAFTRAQQDLERANRELTQERKAARVAKAEVADQSAVVAALTVQQLQTQAGTSPLLTLLGQEDTRDLLARWSAYEYAAEAMTARIDDLTARQTVHRVALRRLERSRERLQRAVEEANAARRIVNDALATSKRATLAAAADRQSGMPPPTHPSPLSPAPATTEAQAPLDATPAPEPPPSAARVPAPPAADDSDIVWDRIAQCESGGNWHINTGNGYYGGLQFSERTWRGVGGPGLPHEHSREVQIHYARILQARNGWDQWSCANARFG